MDWDENCCRWKKLHVHVHKGTGVRDETFTGELNVAPRDHAIEC